MEVVFSNITVTVDAPTPAEAYALLCAGLGSIPESEFITDTFDTKGADGDLDNFRNTSELWPHHCDGCGREESVCSASPCAGVIADRNR
jgi:hypothetical protein